MSQSTYSARSNEITKAYYFHIKRQFNDGLSKVNAYARGQQDGQMAYFMYN